MEEAAHIVEALRIAIPFKSDQLVNSICHKQLLFIWNGN